MIKIPKRRFIRPGQRHYYRKGTRQQIDERRGLVARMLEAGATKTEIHRAVREKFNVQWRQCDRYISWLAHARKEERPLTLPEMMTALNKLLADRPN